MPPRTRSRGAVAKGKPSPEFSCFACRRAQYSRNGIGAQGCHIETPVKQALFYAALSDGKRLTLATLVDGRCAVLRDDTILFDYPGDRDGLERAVARFCSLARIDLAAAPDDAE